MTAVVLALVWLAWQNPSTDANGCLASTVPLTDLAEVQVHGRLWSALNQDSLLVVKPEVGAEAKWDSVPFEAGSQLWMMWVTSTDLSGNESCRSNYVGLNVASVPLPPPEPLKRPMPGVIWYDVMGRVTHGPNGPGIYFKRINGGPAHRVVILR